MNYSNFEPQNNMRPKSPALKSYYPHNSNFRYQPNRQGPYNKFANRKWSSTYDDNRKKPYQPKNNRKFFHNNYNSQDHFDHKQSPSKLQPSSPPTVTQKQNDEHDCSTNESFIDSSVNEAVQTYETDRTTIAEVTQMLINEEQDLKQRLLLAMEKVLVGLKQKHDQHVEYLLSNKQSTND